MMTTTNDAAAVPENAVETRTVSVTLYYRLSEAGQRAAILAGLPAQAAQVITGLVPATDLDLCEITADGEVVSPALLRPGAQRNRWDVDAVPAGPAEVLAAVRARRDADKAATEERRVRRLEEEAQRERKAAERFEAVVAELRAAMDADPHAIPDLDRYREGPEPYGNHPIAVEIRARRDAADATKAEAKAIAEAVAKKERDDCISAFLDQYGDDEMRERFGAGMLPDSEVLAAMNEAAFSGPLAEFPRYKKITCAEAYAGLDEKEKDIVDAGGLKVRYRSNAASKATAEEWKQLKAIRAAMPGGAEATLMLHESTFDSSDVCWGGATRKGIRVTLKHGPFELLREYSATAD
jgi:hypothetical protein